MQEEQLRQEQLSALREACKRLFPACEEVAIAAWGDGYITHEQLDNALKDMKAIQGILKIAARPSSGRQLPNSDVRWPSDDPYSGTHISPGFYRSTSWHFPSPDVSAKVEPKEPIRIVPLREGYLVEYGNDLADQKGFTDRMGVAEWLLEWLGLDTELEDAREVAVTAWAYTENPTEAEYRKLIEAVNDWGRLPGVAFRPRQVTHYDEYEKALGVAEAAWAYTESDDFSSTTPYCNLVEAVKKWRGTEGE